jgi:ketosteroid isomerase-like protein
MTLPPSRRSVLAASGVGLASLGPAAARPSPETEKEVATLVQRSADSNAALMRGDIETYLKLVTLTDDFRLMSPFGGPPSKGTDYTPDRMAAMGRFFRNGSHAQELVQAWAVEGMVVLALIERSHVEVGGLPTQDWALRVTLVYRRDGSDWRLVHRHADPQVAGISLEESAALARRTPQGAKDK